MSVTNKDPEWPRAPKITCSLTFARLASCLPAHSVSPDCGCVRQNKACNMSNNDGERRSTAGDMQSSFLKSVALCIPWWQMNKKGGRWEFESHTPFPSTTMSYRLPGLWPLTTLTTWSNTLVLYDYCLPRLVSTFYLVVYLDHSHYY